MQRTGSLAIVLMLFLTACGEQGTPAEGGGGMREEVTGTTAEPVADQDESFPVVTGWVDDEPSTTCSRRSPIRRSPR